MHKLARRDLLAKGAGVAALAVIGAAVPARAESEDKLLKIINQYKAELARLDLVHVELDQAPRSEKEVDAFYEPCGVVHERAAAILESAAGVPAMAGPSLAVLDLVDEELTVGDSIFRDHIAELMKAVRAYIATTAVA